MDFRCEHCLFWAEAGDHGGNEAFRTGKCHRFPPQGNNWAKTMPNDWCWEFSDGREPVPDMEVVHE